MPMRETFSNSIELAVIMNMINEYDQGTVMHISAVLWHVYHIACRTVIDFLDIYLTTFSESVIPQIEKL